MPGKGKKIKSVIDNSKRMARVSYRLKPYRKLAWHAIRKKVPISELLRTQFPFVFSNNTRPIVLGMEFTNRCNLSCLYCKFPTLPKESTGFMGEDVLLTAVQEIKRMGIHRVIVGGGEPTLHPDFEIFSRKLSEAATFLSIVTNGQWEDDDIPRILLEAPYDLVEISLDSGGEEHYEASRQGADYASAISNIEKLYRLRDRMGVRTLINIRLMVRPSQRHLRRREIKRLSRISDAVMPQYILKLRDHDYGEDVFLPKHNLRGKTPRCKRPFNNLIVTFNGDVPLCAPSYNDFVIGNIREQSLEELWNSSIMRQYRYGLRRRLYDIALDCKGCSGT